MEMTSNHGENFPLFKVGGLKARPGKKFIQFLFLAKREEEDEAGVESDSPKIQKIY